MLQFVPWLQPISPCPETEWIHRITDKRRTMAVSTTIVFLNVPVSLVIVDYLMLGLPGVATDAVNASPVP